MTSCIMNKLLIALIVVVIGFMISETIVVTAQSNSTKMDKQNGCDLAGNKQQDKDRRCSNN